MAVRGAKIDRHYVSDSRMNDGLNLQFIIISAKSTNNFQLRNRSNIKRS
jgi:hypothetical protein